MKSIVCLTLLVVVTLAIAQPVVKETVEVKEDFVVSPAALEEVQPAAPVAHQRYKRATCDLLSFLNVNNSACAVHCLAKRFKGGYCNSKAVCVCRH